MIDYTTVIGLDHGHFEQLKTVWPTWLKHKPSLLDHPLIIFYDWQSSLRPSDILQVVKDHPNHRLYGWPPSGGYTYEGDESSKWHNPQRYKMLAGFVHVPRIVVKTKYWLKLDLDTVAVGNDDWIEESWFESDPAIVSHPWGYTKPADQMLKLDDWFDRNCRDIRDVWNDYPLTPILNLKPSSPSSSLVRHKRIISWCAFFDTHFTTMCSMVAGIGIEGGKFQLPVSSQDGYLWYMAIRGNFPVIRANMKSKGWEHWSTTKNVRKAAERALHGEQNTD